MLFGGNSGSCGGCGCKSCQECTRGCTNPHTGTAFETVYTLYFEGAEAGNPDDGYLEAIGDVDTSDPYDGMDGNGPWSQTVTGTFSLTKTTTRYPCYLTVSFWRSNFVLGANTIPPPATTLTTELITVTNHTSSEGAIYAGGFLLQPGESHQFDMTIPLVSGAGDQSTNDPGLYNGTIRVGAACVNDYVSFTVGGNIAWNVKKRQHVLYGRVRECYEEPGFSGCGCTAPSVRPENLYLTLSNFNITARYDNTTSGNAYLVHTAAQMQALLSQHLAATLTLQVVPGLCDWWGIEASASPCYTFPNGYPVSLVAVIVDAAGASGALDFEVRLLANIPGTGDCVGPFSFVRLYVAGFDSGQICSPYSKSGSATFTTSDVSTATNDSYLVLRQGVFQAAGSSGYNSPGLDSSYHASYSGSFDWEITS